MNLSKIYEKIKQDPFLTTVIGGLTLAAITVLCRLVTGKITTKTLESLLGYIKNTLIYKIPIWIILILLIILKMISHFRKNKSGTYIKDKDYEKHIRDYNRECYEGFVFTWDYTIENGKLVPNDIHPICPKCSTPLKVKDHYIYMDEDNIVESVKAYCPRLDLSEEEIIYKYPNVYDEICENIDIVINTNLNEKEREYYNSFS